MLYEFLYFMFHYDYIRETVLEVAHKMFDLISKL